MLRLLSVLSLATIFAIALVYRWTVVEFALLVVYDVALVALLALVERPLRTLSAAASVIDDPAPPTSSGLLWFLMAMFLMLSVDVGLAMGLQAIATLPPRSDALELTTAWSQSAQGLSWAVVARALYWLFDARLRVDASLLRLLLRTALGTATLIVLAIVTMLNDDFGASLLVGSVVPGAWLLLSVPMRRGP